MPKSLQYKPKFLLSQHSLLSYPVGESITSLQRTNYAPPKSPFFHSSISLSHKTHIQKPIICARNNKRRSGSQRLTRFILQSIPIIASNLKILPQPFDLVIGEFGGGGGGGGGIGFLKGFGGGRFDGWRRRGKKNLGFLGFLVVCGLALCFGRELKSDLFWWVLGFGLFGVVFVKGWKRGVKDWVLGLCLFGVLVGLGLRRDEVQKLVERFRVCCSPVLEILKRRRRNGRSSF